jgi:hypothetical protein
MASVAVLRMTAGKSASAWLPAPPAFQLPETAMRAHPKSAPFGYALDRITPSVAPRLS